MNHNKGKEQVFSKESFADAIRLWERAAISLVDIRHHLISPEEAIRSYRMPANTFLYTSGGKAEVSLDDTAYRIQRFGLFHGGKGTELTITPIDNWLEYYMVLYKAEAPPFHKHEFSKLLERTNPFRHQYGFMPGSPVFFSQQLRRMYEQWKGATPLKLFYGKTAFYQLVYEIYEELDQGNIHLFEPDIVAMAKQYLDRHYRETVTIQEMCSMIGVSYSHFHRSFKQRMGTSPQEYLIKTRLSAATELLIHSQASIREIADHCGFPDEVNFYRQFMKYIGIAPSLYKENSQLLMGDFAIENLIPFPYNEQDQVSLGKLKGEGVGHMFKQMRSKAIVAAALSVMLLLSACGTGAPANTNGAQTTPSQEAATQAPEAGDTPTTRIYTDMAGREVQIPVNPQRIVTINMTAEAIAVGVKPLGAADNWLNSLDDAQKEGIEPIGPLSSLNFEKILELEPDLIITPTRVTTEEIIEDLSKIAPTVVGPFFGDAIENLRTIGDLLGRSEEAEAWLAAYESKAAATKEKLSNVIEEGKTAMVLQLSSTKVIYIYPAGTWPTIHDVLGLQLPDGQELKEMTTGVVLSLEKLTDYDPDYLFLTGTLDEQYDEYKQEIADSSVWRALSAIKNNHVYTLGSRISAGDVLALDWALDEVVRAVEEVNHN